MALSASLVLIGGASWTRFNHSNQAGLVAVAGNNLPQNTYDYDALTSTYLATSTQPGQDNTPLTPTDLVGRQLVIDYLGLAENGQVSDDSLNALADKYVESIPTLVTTSSKTLFDLKVTSNTSEAFQTYASKIQTIYSNYASTLLSSSSNPDSVSLGPQSTAIAVKMAKIYQGAANSLLALSVPSQLAQAHLDLINLYLQDATAAEAISSSDDDPASSFAGLVAFKGNAQKEQEILGNIQKILTDNGV